MKAVNVGTGWSGQCTYFKKVIRPHVVNTINVSKGGWGAVDAVNIGTGW